MNIWPMWCFIVILGCSMSSFAEASAASKHHEYDDHDLHLRRGVKNFVEKPRTTTNSPGVLEILALNRSVRSNLFFGHPPDCNASCIPRYVTVDQLGSGDYTAVQAAVDSVPEGNKHWVYILIQAGIYIEKVTIPYNKPYVLFQGEGREVTVITWNDRASTFGTAESATFSANAPNFVARDVGFMNAAAPPSPGAYGGQAVAVLLAADMMAFYECAFVGAQDTLFDYHGRHYFKNCVIEGSIDFIFGNGQSTYRGCQLIAKAEAKYVSGSITAQNREDPIDGSGFVFVNCSIYGTGEVFLGRAWGAYSRVVFMFTYMSGIIAPQGWDDWSNAQRESTVYYGQYKCYGPGADLTGRVPWSHELSDEEAQPFLDLNFINDGDWLQEI